MPRITRLAAFFLAATVLLNWTFAQSGQNKTWLCYYDKYFGLDEYGRFDIVVLDGFHHPALRRYEPGKPLLIGYVSVGEEKPGGPAWELVQNKPYVIGSNANWDTLVLDLRSLEWQNTLLDTVIPGVLAQGFDGIFLDTLDSPLALEAGENAQKFSGMSAATVEFLHKLRARYPNLVIVQNRALTILPKTARLIDYVLIESLFSDYDFKEKTYQETSAELRAELIDLVRKGTQENPQLGVLTLEYASANQTEMIRDAIAFSRRNGFIPYVSTIALDQIYYHTLAK